MTTPSKPRVLCVDDEPGVLRSLEALLRGRFEVSATSDVHEALELVRSTEFDVVISDQRMPAMTGTEFLEQVKALSPHSMRLLLTGFADHTEVLESVNDSEVFRFVHKPWDNRRLIDTVTYAASVAREVPLQRPAAVPANEPDAVVVPLPQHGSDNRAVLLMDKDPSIEHQLRSALGHSTLLLWARSPGEAMRLMHRQRVAVIVADTRSGNEATLDLIRAVKRGNPNTVAVIHAADCDSSTISRLINEGQIFRFITKPATQALIEQTIAQALNRHRELMARPSSIARHAVDISRVASSASARCSPGDSAQPQASDRMDHNAGARTDVPVRARPKPTGVTWLKRLLRMT